MFLSLSDDSVALSCCSLERGEAGKETGDYECKRLLERSMNSSISTCLRLPKYMPTQTGKLNALHMNFINILFQVEK